MLVLTFLFKEILYEKLQLLKLAYHQFWFKKTTPEIVQINGKIMASQQENTIEINDGYFFNTYMILPKEMATPKGTQFSQFIFIV